MRNVIGAPPRPHVEAIEARRYLSVAPQSMPSASPIPAAMNGSATHVSLRPSVQHVRLMGTVTGTWSSTSAAPDTGASAHFDGTGTVAPLSAVNMSGDLNGVGLIRRGHASGVFTLTGSAGAVTLNLIGPPQAGFSPLPGRFRYTVAQPTGAGGKVGGGVGTLQLSQGQAGGTFTLTFHR